MKDECTVPVLFLVFNRPDTTRRVFEVIRQAKPSRLYIAADGPRENKPGEDQKVQAVRGYVLGNVDWDCEVKTLFRPKNLGCKLAVSSAIDWFFENEEEGIILEDDILPDPSFFPFCVQLLDKYRHDERVMMISGNNLHGWVETGPNSYYFSKYGLIWGWASWRRAWKRYDVTMRLWPQRCSEGFLKTLDTSERFYWRWNFEHVFSGHIDTWDYQWCFASLVNKGLAVISTVNLISNIGFGEGGTHTKEFDARRAAFRIESIRFPLIHPEKLIANDQADKLLRDNFHRMSILKYVWRTFKEKIGLK